MSWMTGLLIRRFLADFPGVIMEPHCEKTGLQDF